MNDVMNKMDDAMDDSVENVLGVIFKAFVKKAERGFDYFSQALDEFDYTKEQKEKFFAICEEYIEYEDKSLIAYICESYSFFARNKISFNEVGIKYIIENLRVNEANAKRLLEFIGVEESWYAYSYLVNNFESILGKEEIKKLRNAAEKKFNFFW